MLLWGLCRCCNSSTNQEMDPIRSDGPSQPIPLAAYYVFLVRTPPPGNFHLLDQVALDLLFFLSSFCCCGGGVGLLSLRLSVIYWSSVCFSVGPAGGVGASYVKQVANYRFIYLFTPRWGCASFSPPVPAATTALSISSLFSPSLPSCLPEKRTFGSVYTTLEKKKKKM